MKREIKNIHFLTLVAVLLAGGILVNWFEQRGEASVERKSLREFPKSAGQWVQRGDEIRFGEQTESVLKTTDYTMREYSLPNGRIANVYVGFYASQRTGVTYHSPQNCLPGAGWVMTPSEVVEITTASGVTFEANRFLIENGIYNEVLLYWYQGRGRMVASEYKDKFYTVFDSILRQRSDGSMVRVMTSVGESESDATNEAIKLSALLAENLDEFVPN